VGRDPESIEGDAGSRVTSFRTRPMGRDPESIEVAHKFKMDSGFAPE
jgi:hypothetical protein